jgi:hypothetical protein
MVELDHLFLCSISKRSKCIINFRKWMHAHKNACW